MADRKSICVVKLGGSLLDLPDVVARFNRALEAAAPGMDVLLLVGGGQAADVVRSLDQQLQLSDEAAHWLAIEAMAINAHAIATAEAEFMLASDIEEAVAAWHLGRTAVVDPLVWLRRESSAGIDIPHRWSFTSDSISAHVASQVGAARLVLLKSSIAEGAVADRVSVESCETQGLVDGEFAEASRDLDDVMLIDLRSQPAGTCRIDTLAVNATRRTSQPEEGA